MTRKFHFKFNSWKLRNHYRSNRFQKTIIKKINVGANNLGDLKLEQRSYYYQYENKDIERVTLTAATKP